MNGDAVELAAAMLVESRLGDHAFDTLPPELRPSDESEAYAIQDRAHARLTAAGLGEQVGFKIGCTTRVMQVYLGIDNPCAGTLFSTTVAMEHGEYRHHGDRRLGVECEVSVRLHESLPPRREPYTRADAAAAVGECMASIEIVEDRYREFGALDTPTLIADDFFNAGLVLGVPRPDFDPMDLDRVSASMTVDGVIVGAGVGSDVMGHPLDALAWLANSRSARGVGLSAGDVVTLGSLVQTNWVRVGSTVSIDNDLLGTATAVFT